MKDIITKRMFSYRELRHIAPFLDFTAESHTFRQWIHRGFVKTAEEVIPVKGTRLKNRRYSRLDCIWLAVMWLGQIQGYAPLRSAEFADKIIKNPHRVLLVSQEFGYVIDLKKLIGSLDSVMIESILRKSSQIEHNATICQIAA